jgi:ectoine hydroxylase-related dioxygenase (phytanoyl-CoA dioxygenase family)
MRISEAHLKHWREHGYAVAENFLSATELSAVQAELSRNWPSREEYLLYPQLYRNDTRGGHVRELPYLGDTLNFVAIDPEIVSFVERALGTDRIALAQSIVWAKYPGLDDHHMPLHVDYVNTSILYPDPREPPEEVTFLLYYVDVDAALGPTYVVSRQHSRDQLLVPYIRPRDRYPDLYRHEQPIEMPAGSMLIYSMATFHRPSAITSADRTRYSHHIVYRSADAPWVGYRTWANHGLAPEFHRFMERASPRQRELLGFPSPSHPYWTEPTLIGVAARYPAMDMTPYLEAANLPAERRERLRVAIRERPAGRAGAATTEYQRERPAVGAGQSAAELTYSYCRGVADYFSTLTGVPSGFWLGLLGAAR